jgi:hypothetical protein
VEASYFRDELYACLTIRGDELFTLADAVLRTPGAVHTNGGAHAAVRRSARSRRDVRRPPPGPDRRLARLSFFPASRTGAATSMAGRRGPRHSSQAARTRSSRCWRRGATSWTQILDAVRLGPPTTRQRSPPPGSAMLLNGSSRRAIGGPGIRTSSPRTRGTIVTDAGCDVTRLSWVLRDLPVELIGRIRGDCVKHGPQFRFAKPENGPKPPSPPARPRRTTQGRHAPLSAFAPPPPSTPITLITRWCWWCEPTERRPLDTPESSEPPLRPGP